MDKFIWNDNQVCEFSKLSTKGSHFGIFRGVKNIQDKLKLFKEMNKIEKYINKVSEEDKKPYILKNNKLIRLKNKTKKSTMLSPLQVNHINNLINALHEITREINKIANNKNYKG